MNTEQIIRQVIGTVLALSAEQILLDKPLIEYGLDSVRTMDVVAGIEDMFDIEIDEMEMATLHTLRQVIALVEQKTQELA